MDKVRVLRILEYIGDRDWVENTLSHSIVPINGEKNDFRGRNKIGIIRSKVLGDFMETIYEEDENFWKVDKNSPESEPE